MPNIYIIAGSNGSGKTTLANTLLPEYLFCNEFVNADLIAAGLSPFNPDFIAIQAGRLMLERINDLVQDKRDFAFETTLSTRAYANYIKKWIKGGYAVHLIFLWVNNVDISIERVKKRVQAGGHSIPEEIIRRRYGRGIYNFLNIYKSIVTSWEIDNDITIHVEDLWERIQLQK